MVLDKNITKYIKINERQIICGQNSNGIWYCKELPCDQIDQLDSLIGEVNKVMNKYNNGGKEKEVNSPKK